MIWIIVSLVRIFLVEMSGEVLRVLFDHWIKAKDACKNHGKRER